MLDESWREELAPNVRTLQIIVGALIAGSLAFLVVALLVPLDGAEDLIALPVSYGALAFAGAVVVTQPVVAAIMVSSGRRRIAEGTWQLPQGASGAAATREFLERTGDAGKLMMVLTMRTIVSAAMFEGATFLALVAYMMESYRWCLLAAVALIFGIAWNMPTQGRVVNWIASQLRHIEHERQFQ